MSITQDDMSVIIGEVQGALDASCFSGEAFVKDEYPYTVYVLVRDQVLNEPGTCGRYPFYQSKQWLLAKVEEFVASNIDSLLDSWSEYDCLREHSVEPVNVGRDGDSCQLLVAYRLA